MIEYLFLDLDDTILDFHKAEHIALGKTLREFGIEPTQTVLDRYTQINQLHWQRLERGEITREQVKRGRFAVLFDELGVQADPALVTAAYEKHLAVGHYFLPGAQEALNNLRGKYRLFLASNGTAHVQAGRLTSAGLYPFFEQVFVSEEMGHNKPSKAYFDACFARIPGFDPGKAMIVGDSLTSDILGGKNAGIATCWVNPAHRPPRPDIIPDYEIPALSALEALLETLD
ncbi:MAG: YjjG family noncanonical pyrimidine nucleotidase [Oscillospiraceae bacterium]|nr:YjjG family noncanonical pyrimidine nucleotidase [Oscillospiraceae bacterium]